MLFFREFNDILIFSTSNSRNFVNLGRKIIMEKNIEKSEKVESIQSQQYTKEELARLREFVETVKNDDARSALACWGDHHDYSHGY